MPEVGELVDVRAFTQLKEAENILQLITCEDAQRSVFRRFKIIENDRTACGKIDHLFTLVEMIGKTWDTIDLIRNGRKREWLNEDLLCGNSEFQRLWKEIQASEPNKRNEPRTPWVRRMKDLRNACYGHFGHPEPARRFLRRLRQGEDPAAFVHIEGDNSINICCPVVWECLLGYILDAKPGAVNALDQARKYETLLGETVQQVEKVICLASQLLQKLMEKHGVEVRLRILDPKENSDEAITDDG